MGIFGKFRVEIPKQTLRNMKKGLGGYIFCSDFIISRNYLCIPLDTEVFYKIEDIQSLDCDNYVAIYKMEDGLEPDCFDISLEEDPSFDEREWYLVPNAVIENYVKSNDWIAFPSPEIFYDEVSYIEDFCSKDINDTVAKPIEKNSVLVPSDFSKLTKKRTL